MATTLRPSTRATRASGTQEPVFELEPPGTANGRSRWPEVSVGLLIIGLFALAGGWLYSNASSTEAVVALRNDVERGQVITANDLRVVEIASDDALNYIGREQSRLVVGQMALADLRSGTLASTDLFVTAAVIPSGSGIIGLALDPGEYPTLSLRPGDRVRVVGTPDQDGDSQLVLAERAEVVDVAPIGVQNQLFVSLAMTTEQTDAVAAASADDRVRLVQVGAE